jgi:FkbM family methyltransferase
MSFSIKLGNFLFNYAFVLYRPLYGLFKAKQDAFEIDLLRKHIREGDTVVDIGANIGFYAKILSEIVGSTGKVHCFEPDKINFQHLEKSCKALENVVLNNKAVGPRSEKIKIYTSKKLNVDHRTYKPEEYDQELEIEAMSLDEYFAALGQTKVDFIKMDIQGFEMQAVKGMEQTLARNSKVKIISEFWPYGLRKAGSSVVEYFEFLRERGFDCFLLEGNALRLLDSEKVKSISSLGEEHYFNIFASRNNV